MLIKGTYVNKQLTEKQVSKITAYIEKRNPDFFILGNVDCWKRLVINQDFIVLANGKKFSKIQTEARQKGIDIKGSFYKVYRNNNTLSCEPITHGELFDILDACDLVKDIVKEPNLQSNDFHYVI